MHHMISLNLLRWEDQSWTMIYVGFQHVGILIYQLMILRQLSYVGERTMQIYHCGGFPYFLVMHDKFSITHDNCLILIMLWKHLLMLKLSMIGALTLHIVALALYLHPKFAKWHPKIRNITLVATKAHVTLRSYVMFTWMHDKRKLV